jgi:hypothetical protein
MHATPFVFSCCFPGRETGVIFYLGPRPYEKVWICSGFSRCPAFQGWIASSSGYSFPFREVCFARTGTIHTVYNRPLPLQSPRFIGNVASGVPVHTIPATPVLMPFMCLFSSRTVTPRATSTRRSGPSLRARPSTRAWAVQPPPAPSMGPPPPPRVQLVRARRSVFSLASSRVEILFCILRRVSQESSAP